MRFLLLALLAFLDGCVIVPNVTEEPFVPEQERFVAGVTTRMQVKEALGEPVFESEHELHYYDTEVRFVAMAFVPGASDAYIDDEAYYVVFKFDDSDLLNEVEWNREHNRFLGPGQFSDESIAYALSTPLDELDLLAYGSAQHPHPELPECNTGRRHPKRPYLYRCPVEPYQWTGFLVLTNDSIKFLDWVKNEYQVLWEQRRSDLKEIIRLKGGNGKLVFVDSEGNGPDQVTTISFPDESAMFELTRVLGTEDK